MSSFTTPHNVVFLRGVRSALTADAAWMDGNYADQPARGVAGFDGRLDRALGAIKAKATVMAGQTDLYFTPADIESDAAGIPGARFRVIPSLWGHMAGAGLNPLDSHFIETEITALLSS